MTNPKASRLACSVILTIFASLTLVGCHIFQLTTRETQDKTVNDSSAGAPSKFQFRVSQFVFLSDFEIQRQLPIFKELALMREQVFKDLKLPPSNVEVFVYLFEDQEKYERYMQAKYPELPKRRAFFVAQPRRLGGKEDLLVFTYWGHRIQQDLRHELTHALLHSVLKDVPLWLDEGLAEYYELPATWNGINPQHIDQLLLPKTTYNLERLELMLEVQQMAPGEYREAWAWVHLMLHSTPQAKQVLVAYLQDLRTNPQPGPLRPRLTPAFLNLESALRIHLSECEQLAKKK